MSTRFVPRSDTLEDVIEKFHIAFVDMLVGKMDEGKFVNKGDMYKAMQAVVRVLFLCMQRSTDDLVIMQQLVIGIGTRNAPSFLLITLSETKAL
jgi:hypothetical protein